MSDDKLTAETDAIEKPAEQAKPEPFQPPVVPYRKPQVIESGQPANVVGKRTGLIPGPTMPGVTAMQEAAEPETPADQTRTPAGYVRLHFLKNCNFAAPDGHLHYYRTNKTNCGLPGYYDLPEFWVKDPWLLSFTDAAPPTKPAAGTVAAARAELQEVAKQRVVEQLVAQEEKDALEEQRISRVPALKKQLRS